VAFNVLTEMDSSTRHWRMLRNRAFDVCELSLSSYLVARDQGYPLEAIPVFLHRRFRHGFIFINRHAGIREPGDLIGKRIGVKTFQTTAILWLRGILEHEYGVPHTEVRWVSELTEDVAFTPGPGLTLERAPAGRRVEDMLAEGEIDACLHADLIDPIVNGDPRVGRLFENYAEVERAYFRRTGIYPIMHTVAIRRDTYEKYPWSAMNLLNGFEAAKKRSCARLASVTHSQIPVPWIYDTVADLTREMFPGGDYWPYGIEPNRPTIEAFLRFCYDQGLCHRRLEPEDLYPEEVQTVFRV